MWLQYWKLVIADNYGAEITSFHGLKFYGVGKSNLVSPYTDILKFIKWLITTSEHTQSKFGTSRVHNNRRELLGTCIADKICNKKLDIMFWIYWAYKIYVI